MPIEFVIPLLALFAIFIAIGVLRLRRERRIWFVGGGNGVLNQLHERKAILLRAIKDLEQEHETGKVGTETFETQRQELMQEAILINQRIEKAKGVVQRIKQQMSSGGANAA